MNKIVWSCCMLFLLCRTALGDETPGHTETPKCGYESCNKEKPGMINVHLVAHTHTDPGWLITVDQYYNLMVRFVIDSLMPALEENPSRRFTYVEMSFFSRWWASDLDQKTRDRVRKLINEGRLEFTLGGWVMNDEAATHYTAIINQHKRGFEFIRETFGDCGRTKIGWQIDPFGHSRTQASFFSQFGFDGYFFGRLDHEDSEYRQKQHRMEFLWEASPKNLGLYQSIFTGILPNRYEYPNGYRFDVSTIYASSDDQNFINDEPGIYGYNVDKKVHNFIKEMNKYRSWFNTDHVIVPMGSDYNYVDARINFSQMDKLIKYVNARQENGSKINVLYSTPSCYLKALNGEQRTWTTKQDDFFPYSHREHSYWTGFYTSRPSAKLFTRRANAYNQAVKKLIALAKLDDSKGSLSKSEALENSVSLSQHHDAITGTEKQVVAYDYAQRIAAAQKKAEDAVYEAYTKLMPKNSFPLPQQVTCHYTNVSVCALSQSNKKFEVTLFNALASPRNFTIRVPVNDSVSKVSDGNNSSVPFDVFPTASSRSGIRPSYMTPSKFELYFETTLPGMGFKTFFVESESSAFAADLKFTPEKRKDESTYRGFIESDFYKLFFDATGAIETIYNKKDGTSVNFTQNFYCYKAFQGPNTSPELQSSGAYIFRPIDQTPYKFSDIKKVVYKKGAVVQEVRQVFSVSNAAQVVRLYKHSPTIEVEWTIGPIPVSDQQGKEIVTRYNVAGLDTNGTFFTDSNGREMLERRLNYRPTWPALKDEPVSENYYPVNSIIYIKNKTGFAVLPDRAEGGTSLNNGDIELMLHRRLLRDDWLGVAEALNETGLDGNGLIARGTHQLVIGEPEFVQRVSRTKAQEVFQRPLVTFSASGLSRDEYINRYKTEYTGLAPQAYLPKQVNVLSFEKFRLSSPVKAPEGTVPYLVRLEHIFEKDEDVNMSKPVSFDVKGIFEGFTVDSVEELTLGANFRVGDIKRLVWKIPKGTTPSDLLVALNGTTVTLHPMQITTLQVNFRI